MVTVNCENCDAAITQPVSEFFLNCGVSTGLDFKCHGCGHVTFYVHYAGVGGKALVSEPI